MDINKLLNDFDSQEKKITVENTEYTYIDAKYMYQENLFFRCFILDFISHKHYEELAANWITFENFLVFQRRLLEDEFFLSKGDERYNIYLLFIVKENSKIYEITNIPKDFHYARKIILNENEAKDFLEELLFIKRQNDHSFITDAVERNQALNTISKSADYAEYCAKQELSIFLKLTGYNDVYKNIERMKKIIRTSDTLERTFKSSETERNISKIKKNIEDKRKINFIKNINIKSFRCYENKENIRFAKVNLIYGENGVGKTSLLEAIEFGITGLNKSENMIISQKEFVAVQCNNDLNRDITLDSTQDNYPLAEYWYGIKANDKNEFNNLFCKCNYFDTNWASAFALEKENQIKLLQQFLGIKDLENAELLLKDFYKDLKWISQYNLKKLRKMNRKPKFISIDTSKRISLNNISRLLGETECRLHNYDVESNNLNKQTETISWDELLNVHINKIEKIFKFLISSNEYTELRVKNGEIVAVRNNTNEHVSMSKMSTGQKVCLALAFMFSLYLSSDTSPNIIMMDEPVANLDDYHMLNLLDLLRRLALSDSQIFFTTANPDVAKLFRRKFSFLGEDFKFFTVTETNEITCETYSPTQDKAIEFKKI